MRSTIPAVLVFFVSCSTQHQQELPAFEKNATIEDVWDPIEYLTHGKDLALYELVC
jgi:hypothetical protein